MKFISCSTLHISLLPKGYAPYMHVLYVGLDGEPSAMHYVASEEVFPRKYAVRYAKAIERVVLDSGGAIPASLQQVPDGKEETKEDIEQLLLGTKSIAVEQNNKVLEQAYQALITAYLLEKREQEMNVEYENVLRSYEQFVSSLPDSKDYAFLNYIPKQHSYMGMLWKQLPSYIHAVVGEECLLVSSSKELYMHALEHNACMAIPEEHRKAVDTCGFSEYTIGYIEDFYALFPNGRRVEKVPILLVCDREERLDEKC